MNADQHIVTVRPAQAVDTLQRLPYFVGIGADTVGSSGLSMSLVVIPPGAVSEPHYHEGYETAIYVLSGRVETRYGAALEHVVINGPGDFVFVPPGLPHQARNLTDTESARAIVARNDPAERERVQPYAVPMKPE
ncbi:cupin domain-containing protein [Ectothiorhodospiraceae bacterium 2226]|nr:cupin domain-containing protein [Ectothiorhodospiraceae bacterium 2226]